MAKKKNKKSKSVTLRSVPRAKGKIGDNMIEGAVAFGAATVPTLASRFLKLGKGNTVGSQVAVAAAFWGLGQFFKKFQGIGAAGMHGSLGAIGSQLSSAIPLPGMSGRLNRPASVGMGGARGMSRPASIVTSAGSMGGPIDIVANRRNVAGRDGVRRAW